LALAVVSPVKASLRSVTVCLDVVCADRPETPIASARAVVAIERRFIGIPLRLIRGELWTYTVKALQIYDVEHKRGIKERLRVA
jgi:hypothetical protein